MKNLKIGVRLGLGFAAVLALLGLMMLIGIWQLNATAAATRDMMATPLAKERLTEEWFRTVTVGVTRAKAIAKSADTSLEALFAEDLKIANVRGAEIIKAIQAFPMAAEEQKLMDRIAATRKTYLDARDAMMKAKRDGKVDEANRIYDTTVAQAGPIFMDSMKAYLDHQHQTIDVVARDNDANAVRARMGLALLGCIALLVGGLFAWLLTRSVTRPIREAVEVTEKVAEGDLTSHITVTSKDEMGRLLQALKNMNGNLVKIVGDVRSGTEAIASGTKQIASGNADLSQRTEEQASSLEETASSMEELTSTVKQNAENARQANQLAQGASAVAVKGGKVVGEVVGTMSSINESSKKIVDIISVIDGIAFQTNILALNAAVEAARAGEQGRGFAVVASEVRSLAQRSAAAAKEIKALIGDSVDKVGAGTKLVDEAGKTMEEIVASVKRVTDIMSEITAASQEQSSGIEQVNQAINQMEEVTQQNAALVEEAAAASASLDEQAKNLATAVAVFRLHDSGGALSASFDFEGRGNGERSAPKRVANVARLPAKPVATPKTAVSRAKIAAAGGGGSEDRWEEF